MERQVNKQIARLFRVIALYLRSQDIAFKPQAYERAAQSLDLFAQDVSILPINDLEAIPGIGKALALKIKEFSRTGKLKELDRLKKRFPFDMEALAAIEGIGPKTAYKLYKKLRIKTVDDLRRVLEQRKLRLLPGFGEKSEAKLLAHLRFSLQGTGRFLLGAIYDQAHDIERRLTNVSGVERVCIAGSVRRMKETVRDMDILAVSGNPGALMDYFVSLPGIVEVYGKGNTKASVRLESGIDVDLRVVPERSWGAALNYFTGSKEHNIALREIAIAKKWKLSEYGLFAARNGKESRIAGKTEEGLYRKLGLAYIEPEMRENLGEIILARRGKLPKLVALDDIRADLQMHTDWSDGRNSLEDMARQAIAAGYACIAVTDHTKALGVARGMDERTILKQFSAIDALNRKYKGKITVLKGLEVNIGKTGTLDIKDEVLARADLVGASVHSLFSMPQTDMTRRIMRAMDNRHVDIVFHPTGRLINGRPGYALDMEMIAAHARKTGTLLEINASPSRLDLNDVNIRLAKKYGVLFSLGTDSHSVHDLSHMRFGVGMARRGWCEKKDVVNSYPPERLVAFLKKP